MKLTDIKASNGVRILVKNQIVRQALVDAAIKAGWVLSSVENVNSYPALFFLLSSGYGSEYTISNQDESTFKTHNDYAYYQVVSIEQLLSIFEDGCPKPLKVGRYLVNEVSKQGFKVGCETVSWELFDKIAALRPK